MSTVTVVVDDRELRLPAKFYHMIAKLHTVMNEFSFEVKIGKVYCLFEAEYHEIDEDSEDELAEPAPKSSVTKNTKAETPQNSEEETDVEELLMVRIKIDQTDEVFEGEEFWEQFLAVNAVESKNAKRLGKFRFKDNASGIIIRRTAVKASGAKSGGTGTTYLEVFGTEPKKPLIKMTVTPSNLKSLADVGITFHTDLLKTIAFL
jgi:hypothetical protein